MKNLKLPANYAAISVEETVNVCGGGVAAQICNAFGKMFQNATYTTWETEAQKISESHGAVVSKSGNVYTFADGYVHTMETGSSFSFNIGDFFYGLGRLFSIFGL